MTSTEIQATLEHQDFILKNLRGNTADLALKYAGRDHSKTLISQIGWRQKLRKKVPEWYEKPGLVMPSLLATEQASSAATAKLKAELISGEELLDITGGLGIDSFYLSESFSKTTYVEQDAALVAAAEINFKAFDKTINVLHADGLAVLEQSTADVVYIDPYRRGSGRNERISSLKDSTPDVTTIKDQLIKNGRKTLIKTSPMFDLNLGIKELHHVQEIWVISLRNDCKEVVYQLSEENTDKHILVKTFNQTPEGWQQFESTQNTGRAPINTSPPRPYLYEPNSAILKAGLQEEVAEVFGLYKLHPHSNIYTSDEFQSDYLGKIFSLKKVRNASDKKLKKGRYNVIARNFSTKASEIEKKLKLKPHNSNYLIATRLMNDQYALIEARLLP